MWCVVIKILLRKQCFHVISLYIVEESSYKLDIHLHWLLSCRWGIQVTPSLRYKSTDYNVITLTTTNYFRLFVHSYVHNVSYEGQAHVSLTPGSDYQHYRLLSIGRRHFHWVKILGRRLSLKCKMFVPSVGSNPGNPLLFSEAWPYQRRQKTGTRTKLIRFT
jgi:hypothetical protein